MNASMAQVREAAGSVQGGGSNAGTCRCGGNRALEVDSGRLPFDRRWTLVDAYDRDGVRYIVARENRPRSDGLVALSERERQVVEYLGRQLSTKEIAFTMGIADATVRVLIRRAAAKLGATSRASLLAQVEARRSSVASAGAAREEPLPAPAEAGPDNPRKGTS